MKTLIYFVSLFFVFLSFSTTAQLNDPFANICARKKTVVLNSGTSMNYIDIGDTTGIPLIFLPGNTVTSPSFKLMIVELMKINPNFHIITPNLRGRGESSLSRETGRTGQSEKCLTNEAITDDIISLIDKLNLRKVCLMGHSRGSVVAQKLASAHPHRIHTMVLIGSIVDANENSAIRDLLISEAIEKSRTQKLEQPVGFNGRSEASWLTDGISADVTEFLHDDRAVDVCASNEPVREVYSNTMHISFGTWIWSNQSH